jgi:hypothetical protein
VTAYWAFCTHRRLLSLLWPPPTTAHLISARRTAPFIFTGGPREGVGSSTRKDRMLYHPSGYDSRRQALQAGYRIKRTMLRRYLGLPLPVRLSVSDSAGLPPNLQSASIPSRQLGVWPDNWEPFYEAGAVQCNLRWGGGRGICSVEGILALCRFGGRPAVPVVWPNAQLSSSSVSPVPLHPIGETRNHSSVMWANSENAAHALDLGRYCIDNLNQILQSNPLQSRTLDHPSYTVHNKLWFTGKIPAVAVSH